MARHADGLLTLDVASTKPGLYAVCEGAEQIATVSMRAAPCGRRSQPTTTSSKL